MQPPNPPETAGLTFTELGANRAAEIHDLIWRVFLQFEAPDYTPQGVETFRAYIRPEQLANFAGTRTMRFSACFDGAELVGVIGMRENRHIALLFVDARHHRRGIARALVERAVALSRAENPGLAVVTLNSSPYAHEAYRRMGFVDTAPEQVVDGIRFTPMQKEI